MKAPEPADIGAEDVPRGRTFQAPSTGWVGTARPGAIAGPLSLVPATLGYFVMDTWARREPLSWIEIGYWCVAALILGSPLGTVGSIIGRPGLPGAVAGLTAPVGATVQMIVLPPGFGGFTPNPEAETARGLVLILAALATAAVLVRCVRQLRS